MSNMMKTPAPFKTQNKDGLCIHCGLALPHGRKSGWCEFCANDAAIENHEIREMIRRGGSR